MNIFISYCRDDSSGYAQAIYRGLIQHFPKHQVFMDVDTVQPGVDFVREIERAVSSCYVFLALIGNKWASEGRGSKSRLDDPKDFIRLEISTALARDIRIIPVLVDGMKMPSEETLPTPLKPITRRNAMEISHTRFDYDVERVVSAVLLATGMAREPKAETEVLEHLRMQMLISRDSRELRELLYELEAYLAKHPHSPEARLLKEQMQAAMRHAEDMEHPKAKSAPQARSSMRLGRSLLFLLVILGIIVFLLSRFF